MTTEDKEAAKALRHIKYSLLHIDKLPAFMDWVKSEGYIILPKTKHKHEVLRIEPYNPSGSDGDIFFYKREKSDHVTVPDEAIGLVRRFVKSYQKPSTARKNRAKAAARKRKQAIKVNTDAEE